jgi:hypothetical protein
MIIQSVPLEHREGRVLKSLDQTGSSESYIHLSNFTLLQFIIQDRNNRYYLPENQRITYTFPGLSPKANAKI